jgi:hypothetical protein
MRDASRRRSGRRLVRALSKGRSGGIPIRPAKRRREPSKKAGGQLGLSQLTLVLIVCPGV